MSREEVEAMAKAIRSDDSNYSKVFYPLFFILANFGLRISEAVFMVKEDFKDLASGYFHVHRAKKERFRKAEAKSGRRDRRIQDFAYVSVHCRKVLGRLLSETKGDRLFSFSIRSAQLMFGFYLKKAGLRSILTPHSLRRFVITEMDDIGMSTVAQKIQVGHVLDTTDLYKANPIKIMREVEKWNTVE